MKILIMHPESDSAFVEEVKDLEEADKKFNHGEVYIIEIKEGHMFFEHHATGKIVEVKIIATSTVNEIIVEDIKTEKLMVVEKSKQYNRYEIKGTSFIKIE